MKCVFQIVSSVTLIKKMEYTNKKRGLDSIMCGIAGFYNAKVNYSEHPKDCFQIINHMLDSMKMRGPDENGFSIMNNCCLIHTRLKIIDLNTGTQPIKITYQNANFHIIFNGEIYNHREIKRNLCSLGYPFMTSSDTEVIGMAYIHYGDSFVNQLNGIFSIAIYDEHRKSLLLYRDRYGVKPLYYTQYDNTLIFASRIDTLFEYPRVKPRLDINGFNEIFTIGPTKTPGFGVFSGIKEVLPGEYIIINPFCMTKRQYYHLESRPHIDTEEQTIVHTRYLLEDSIKMQMLSDVPICTFLSGGIDSSLVTALCCKHMPQNESLASYSFDYYENDLHFQSNRFQPSEDRPYVDIMKEYLQTNHTYLYCDYKQLAKLLFSSVDSRCLPTMADVDSSLLYFCGEVAKKHKVALTGECADEIFGGYPWFFNEEMLHADTFPWMPDLSFRKSLLNSEFAGALHMEQYVSNAYEKTLSEVQILPHEDVSSVKRRQITYLNIRWFMQTLLDRMDRTSMQHGLEARVPFADHRVIEYVYNIPWDIKAKDGIPKALLREVSRPYLPAQIMHRPKSPYPKTYHPKYEEALVNMLTEIINDSASPIRSYLNIKSVTKFLSEPKEYGKPWFGQLMAGPQMIAYLIQIDYWMRKYNLSL